MSNTLRMLIDPLAFALRDNAEPAGDDKKPAKKLNGRDVEDEVGDPPAGYFSREYVSELRAENKGYRLKAGEQQRLREEAEKKAAAAAEALKAAEEAATKKAEQRIIRAELKAEAVALGMIDLDGLAFVDYSKLKFDEAGNLVGGADALKALKEKKPHLFGAKSTSNPDGSPDPNKKAEPVNARTLKPDEYKALKAKLGLV